MERQQLRLSCFMIIGCAIFFGILQFFQQHLIYQYDVLFSQPWRIWTGHWVHVGWIHYLLNILAFACLPFLFSNIRWWYLIVLLIILPVLLSIIFHFIYPNVFAYAGLSGILHGLFIFCAIVSLNEKKERYFASIILLLILIKIIWEYYFGSFQTAQLIGHPVLTQAHLWGAIFGTLLAIICIIFRIEVIEKVNKNV
ncbi:rhombosortase [Acinetobacter rongchengensis]|uniref:Rhombosortase n=1 Tax=Acinetobacter rongchengensis TaxID=2419601 RepID=A0A3A8F1M8_9GAMM|nr:rhombosortase [Acinetobacter rongchengensis]RKG40318.1 rhombosortase [Acinetobacter rongchengensis]